MAINETDKKELEYARERGIDIVAHIRETDTHVVLHWDGDDWTNLSHTHDGMLYDDHDILARSYCIMILGTSRQSKALRRVLELEDEVEDLNLQRTEAQDAYIKAKKKVATLEAECTRLEDKILELDARC